MVSRHLQRQVLLFLTAMLTVLNGSSMASSCISQKGQCQQNTQNAELTSKLVWLDSSLSQMIYILLVVYTGSAVPWNLQSPSHLKLSTVHHFKTLLSLHPSDSLLPSALKQNSHTNLECWKRGCLDLKAPMAAFKFPSSHSLESVLTFIHFTATAVLYTTCRRVLIDGMLILSSHRICKHAWQ